MELTVKDHTRASTGPLDPHLLTNMDTARLFRTQNCIAANPTVALLAGK